MTAQDPETLTFNIQPLEAFLQKVVKFASVFRINADEVFSKASARVAESLQRVHERKGKWAFADTSRPEKPPMVLPPEILDAFSLRTFHADPKAQAIEGPITDLGGTTPRPYSFAIAVNVADLEMIRSCVRSSSNTEAFGYAQWLFAKMLYSMLDAGAGAYGVIVDEEFFPLVERR